MLLVNHAQATITGASVSPTQRQLVATGANTFTINWRVTASAGHRAGTASSGASLINPANGARLATLGGPLSAGGSGPFSFSETHSIDPSQVNNWQRLGITRLVLQRVFADPGSSATATASMALLIPEPVLPTGITGASVTPAQRDLVAVGVNRLAVSWRVTTEAAHQSGARSSGAILINPADGSSLGSLGGPLSAAGGGPFTFNETLSIDAARVGSWQRQGLTRLVLQRVFTDPGSDTAATASITLLIPEAGLLTAASVSPQRNRMLADRDNRFTASWQVVTGQGHSNGVVSNSARLVNPRNGATLATVGGTLVASGGGPFTFTEEVQLEADLVAGLLDQGMHLVALRRSFVDPIGGGAVEASMSLQLSRSELSMTRDAVTGSLSVQGLLLEFSNGNDIALVEMNEPLRVKLIMSHSGTGLLEGRWQVAEPGSTDSLPLYRTLALVRRNITATQRSILKSPVLPTSRIGKYRVRFCVTNRDMDRDGSSATGQCPIENLVIEAAYQVQGGESMGVTSIRTLSPNREHIHADTAFSWQPVTGARVYQMQVFALVPGSGDLPSAEEQEVTVEPKFIVGMVLPAETTRTPLSELICSKLRPNQRYLWRITAHDETGRLLGISADASFVFTAREHAQ
jgi:hypothetical protein